MYIPKAFEMNDRPTLVEFIKKNSFGILFSHTENGPFATHLPFLMIDDKGEHGVLLGHMAKPNPHWRDLNNKEVLVVFQGSHAYISPSYYKEANTVPTWNYVTAHVYGDFKVIDDKQGMKNILEKTVDLYESGMPNPYKSEFGNLFMDGLMNGIVCFEITIKRIEGKWKLSQNHSPQRQQNVIYELNRSHDDHSKEIAKLMEDYLANGKMWVMHSQSILKSDR